MRSIVAIFILFSFFSCKREKKEFKDLDKNFQYKLLAFEETNHPFKQSNYVRASIKLISGNDTIYSKDDLIPFDPEKTPFSNLIVDLNEGDSICFKVNPNWIKKQHFHVNFTDNNPDLVGYIKIYEFLTIKKYSDFVAQNDPELIEQEILKRYINQFPKLKKKGGVYINTIQKGQGVSVEAGRVLHLKFRASFLDGIEFDNTYYHHYFEYTYGTPNQIIDGLDVALLGMKNKEKAKIIIPSQLAFGDKGSSTGIVPPFTSLVYELEIIDIK